MIFNQDKYRIAVMNAIKNEKYFSNFVADGIMVVTNDGDYVVLFYNHGKELYVFRMLDETESKRLSKNILPNGWVIETNNTDFALVYRKKYKRLPTVAKMQAEIVDAIDTIT